MIRALLLTLCMLAVASPLRAQDDVLRAVDELMASERCDAALALLAHASGSPAELAGRRAICEAALGHNADAAVHVAEALRAPTDPWVVANRSRLLAALSTAAPAQPPAQPAQTPVVSDPPMVVGVVALSPPRIDDDFVARFGTSLPADEPVPRVLPTVSGSRLIVRGLFALGPVFTTKQMAGAPYWRGDLPSAYEVQTGLSLSFRGGRYGGEMQDSGRVDVGVEVESVQSGRVSLVGALELGFGLGAFGDARVYRTTVIGRDEQTGRRFYDMSVGDVEWGPGFGVRGTLGVRLHPGRGRVVCGLGGRFGMLTVHGSADLVDVSEDDDNRDQGAPEGHFERRALGATAEALVDAGFGFGPRRDGVVLLRVGVGVPTLSIQLVFSVPLHRSAP